MWHHCVCQKTQGYGTASSAAAGKDKRTVTEQRLKEQKNPARPVSVHIMVWLKMLTCVAKETDSKNENYFSLMVWFFKKLSSAQSSDKTENHVTNINLYR